jgi:hypothetical protein
MRGLSPSARVSLLPWGFPYWEQFKHTMMNYESQDKRKFQKAIEQA